MSLARAVDTSWLDSFALADAIWATAHARQMADRTARAGGLPRHHEATCVSPAPAGIASNAYAGSRKRGAEPETPKMYIAPRTSPPADAHHSGRLRLRLLLLNAITTSMLPSAHHRSPNAALPLRSGPISGPPASRSAFMTLPLKLSLPERCPIDAASRTAGSTPPNRMLISISQTSPPSIAPATHGMNTRLT